MLLEKHRCVHEVDALTLEVEVGCHFDQHGPALFQLHPQQAVQHDVVDAVLRGRQSVLDVAIVERKDGGEQVLVVVVNAELRDIFDKHNLLIFNGNES